MVVIKWFKSEEGTLGCLFFKKYIMFYKDKWNNCNRGLTIRNNQIENKISSAFLSSYSWEGKERKQIIEEIELEDYEQKYVNQVMKELIQEEKI
ncbi:hypothetical protein ACIKJR_01860 [Bacillus thuringiensis]